MATKHLPLVFLSLFLLALVLIPRQTSAADGRLDAMVTTIDARRQAAGLVKLNPHPMLITAAQRYAEVLKSTRNFSHSADGTRAGDRIRATGYTWSWYAERIAYTYGGWASPEQLVDLWIHDPQAVPFGPLILAPQIRDYGLAVVDTDDGTTYYVWIGAISVQPKVIAKPAPAKAKPAVKKPVRVKKPTRKP